MSEWINEWMDERLINTRISEIINVLKRKEKFSFSKFTLTGLKNKSDNGTHKCTVCPGRLLFFFSYTYHIKRSQTS